MPRNAGIKRVGNAGQISLGKRYVGRYFREEERPDGTILLVPVAPAAASSWSVRDEKKIKKALAWAAKHPASESDLDALVAAPPPVPARKRRGK